MDIIPNDISKKIFLYLDTKSQYNFFLIDRNNTDNLKRYLACNSIEFIGEQLGLCNSDLYDDFFVNYIKEDSLGLLKEICMILEPKNTFKKKYNSYVGYNVKFFLIRKKSMDQCKNHILNSNDFLKLKAKRKKKFLSSDGFNKSLYKYFRNTFSILI